MLALKIAARNIFRHRGKSLVIGSILALGALLLTLGNSVITGMEQGLAQSVVASFTGDIILVSEAQIDDNVILDMAGKPLEDINRFDTIQPYLEQSGLFASWIPAGKNFAMALNEHGGNPGFAFLLGVDLQRWREVFPHSIALQQGQWPDSVGMLMPSGALGLLYGMMGTWFAPEHATLDTAIMSDEAKSNYPNLRVQHDIVFMGNAAGNTAADIRMPIDAVIKFNALNVIWGHFVLVDIDSYRRGMGYFSQEDQAEAISAENQALLNFDEGDLDALFGAASAFAPVATTDTSDTSAVVQTIYEASSSTTTGAYSLVFTRLKPGIAPQNAVDSLQRLFATHNLPLRALTWQKASGVIGSMSTLIKASLNVFVFFLFFVAIIIIVNTLSMAALERTTEIGMMRAVGARKSFIARMFMLETGALAFVFGNLGILLGFGIVLILRALHITTDNDTVQLFFGGNSFNPTFGGADLALTYAQLLAVTVLAALYPMRVAQKITPLDAISRD